MPRHLRAWCSRALRSRPTAAAAGALLTFLSACRGDLPSAPRATHEPPAARPAIATAAATVAVYVHAHQDDWQLFMGDRAYADALSGAKVVFVYTTAGEADKGTAYWQAREAAAKASMDVVAGAGSWTCARQTIRTHAIQRCVKGNVVSYFMRVPNYNILGTGIGVNGRLQMLRDDGTDATAVDGSTTYTTWSELTSTLAGIVDLEAGGLSAPSLTVHAPDYNQAINPADHSDHWASGDAVRTAAGTRAWDVAWYIDYDIKNKTVNLSTDAHAIKEEEFLAYDAVMVARGYASLAANSSYQAWLWRSYFRTQPSGTAPTPPVARAGGPYSGAEGATVAFSSAGSSDPKGQVLAYAWSFGDGTTSTAANPGKRYADNGTYTVKLTVYSLSGGATSTTATAMVANVAPTASFSVPSATEGSAYTISLSATDAGTADRSSLQYAFDCGQGTGWTAWARTTSAACPAVADQRTLTVRGQVRDKDGAVTPYTRTLSVANAAPVVSFSATSSTTMVVGGTLGVQGSFTDKGVTDGPWTYTIVWGDGTATSTGSVTAQGALSPASHVYSKAGTWSATLRVADKDGASTTSVAIPVSVGAPPSALRATGYKEKGLQYASLAWTKGSAPTVDVWRGSTLVRSALPNSGSYTNSIGNKGGGTYTYKVCIAGRTGTTNCSNSATVTF